MPSRSNRVTAGAMFLEVLAIATVFLLSLSGLAGRTLAQTSVDGAISGFVTDPGGAALPGAAILVQHLATGLILHATASRGGEFSLSGVPPGEYIVTVDCAHFERLTLTRVIVEVGGITSIEARLRIGSLATTVTVSATPTGPAPVSVDEALSAAIAGNITSGEIQDLPVNGRRWQTFALLTPTVNADPEGAGLLSFRGAASTQNSSRIDGGDDDQSFGSAPRGTGGDSGAELEDAAESGSSGRVSIAAADGGGGYSRHAGMAYTFSQEAVREFRVSSQNYSALYGHAAGGIVTTISKSGTNTLHGTAFYLLRASALGASNPFSIVSNYANGVVTSGVVKPHDVRQQFGGSLGGAAIQDKLFFFYAFDQQRRNFPAISTPADPNFYALTLTQRALLGNRGVSSSKINDALNYLESLTGTIARRQDQTVNFAKLDLQASARHRLGIQYNRARSSAPAGVRSAPVVDLGAGSLGSAYGHVDSALSRWLWTITPKLSNELRVQYGTDLQYEQAGPPLPQEPAVGPGGFAPEVAIGPYGFTFGTSPSIGRKAYPDERKVELADLLTLIRGRHQLQAGADVSLVHDTISALNNIEGAFHYDSGVTSGHAGGLVDWIADYTFNVDSYPNGACPSITAPIHDFCFRSFSQSFGQQAVTFNTQEWAAFAEDTWRPRPGLTLHVGLRYEYELLPIPQQPNPALDAVFGAIAATSVFPEDRNNFGPRFGVAWAPFGAGNGVLRIGYGAYYGRLPGATVRSALVNTATGSSATHILILPTTVTSCPQVSGTASGPVSAQGFGYACSYLTTPPAAVATTTSATVFDRRFRLPSVQQASITVERNAGAGIVASASYLLNLDRQLPNSTDINIAPSTGYKTFQLQGGTGAVGVRDGETFALPVYAQRINTRFGAVTDIVSNANATYNALVLEARRRSRGGLELRASWTWSKAIDFGQIGATPRTNAQFDPFDVRYDKGLSSLNFPHKVQASLVWQPLPGSGRFFGRDLRLVGSTIRNWQFAPIFTERSGRPYSLDLFGGTRLTGGHESLNGSGGAIYLPTVGRNTLRLPDAYRIDLRVSRPVRLNERLRMRGSVEIFNLTNHVNYSAISQRAFLAAAPLAGVTPLIFQDAATVAAEGLNVRPFGTFTAASSGQAQERQVQLGVRIEF